MSGPLVPSAGAGDPGIDTRSTPIGGPAAEVPRGKELQSVAFAGLLEGVIYNRVELTKTGPNVTTVTFLVRDGLSLASKASLSLEYDSDGDLVAVERVS